MHLQSTTRFGALQEGAGQSLPRKGCAEGTRHTWHASPSAVARFLLHRVKIERAWRGFHPGHGAYKTGVRPLDRRPHQYINIACHGRYPPSRLPSQALAQEPGLFPRHTKNFSIIPIQRSSLPPMFHAPPTLYIRVVVRSGEYGEAVVLQQLLKVAAP